jgi:hypothetical protein
MTQITMLPTLLVALCVLSSAQGAECLGTDPLAAAQEFFGKHRSFVSDDTDEHSDVLETPLFNVLKIEHQCAQGDLCAIEADPWMGAQDGEMERPISFKLHAVAALQATVSMSYTFKLASNLARTQKVELKLARQTTNQCWRLADLTQPDGTSLLLYLTDWQSKYLKL